MILTCEKVNIIFILSFLVRWALRLATTKSQTNAGWLLAQHRRYWPSLKPTLAKRFLFANGHQFDICAVNYYMFSYTFEAWIDQVVSILSMGTVLLSENLRNIIRL